MTDERHEAVQRERALLACFLEKPALIGQVDFDLGADFGSTDHRKLWLAMAQLHSEGIEPADKVLLAERAGVDGSLIADLLGSGAMLPNFPIYLRRVQETAREHCIRRLGEELQAAEPANFSRIIEELQKQRTERGTKRAHFQDIPEVQALDVPAADYIVPALGIARNTITLWTGADGSGKTILAYAMAAAVALRQSFLGMSCQQCPVLYLDLENPGYVAQGRVRAMLGRQSVPQFRAWGTWDEELQPPKYGDPRLLRICKETRPLLIIDPFRYFHDGEEDSSTAMAQVMRYLRACAVCGGAVVILHHPAKAENSKGRGSSAIRAGCDLAFLHTLDKEANMITLRVDKNRHGERRDFRIKADFEEGRFELAQAAWLQRRKDEIAHFQELIAKAPGISASQLAAAGGGRKGRVLKLLEEGAGTLWERRPGLRGSMIFFPIIQGTGSLFPSKEGELGNQSEDAPVVPGTDRNHWELGTTEASQT